MPSFFKCSIFLIGFFTLHTCFAWDSKGHRTISAIAYAHLTPIAQQKIDHITRACPQFARSLQKALILEHRSGVYIEVNEQRSTENQGFMQDIVELRTRPKTSNPAYPALSRFLYLSTLPDLWRKKDKGASASWHFINIPWTTDGSLSQPAASPHIVTVFKTNLSILQNARSSLAEKYTALAYLIHLTEDAHQPLHCINRFSTAFPQGDKGGNLFPIRTKAENLHAYWDQSAQHLLSRNKKYALSNTHILKLAEHIQIMHPENALDMLKKREIKTMEEWVQESYVLAQEKIYGIELYASPSAAYQKMQRETASIQMAVAGYRLADLLNQLFS